MVKKSNSLKIAVGLSLISFLIKLPFSLDMIRLFPDTISYSNIASQLAMGNGFTSTLKLTYTNGSSITHYALPDWPPVYPIFAGMVFKMGGNITALQAVNALLSAIAVGLVFLISEKLFGRRTGLLAGFAAIPAPNLFRSGISALSDPLSLVLALITILLAIQAKDRTKLWLAAGICSGLAFLTRFPNGVIPIILIITLAFRPGKKADLIYYITGLTIVYAPVIVMGLSICKSAFPFVQTLHYAAPSFREAACLTTGDNYSYALQHINIVLLLIIRNIYSYAIDLFCGIRGLFFLSVGLPVIAVMVAGKRISLQRTHIAIFLIAALNFAVYSLTWSIPPVKGSRFLLLTYCLLLPFCARGLLEIIDSKSYIAKSIAYSSLVCTAVCYLWGCMTTATCSDGQLKPLSHFSALKLRNALPLHTNIATNNPWLLNYSTGYPAALLPHNLNGTNLIAFLRKYDIGAVVIFKGRDWNIKYYGQNAYEGTLNMMPHIVQKLPTIHSPRIAPKKKGRAFL